MEIRWIHHSFSGSAGSFAHREHTKKGRETGCKETVLTVFLFYFFFFALLFHLTWQCAPSRRIIGAKAILFLPSHQWAMESRRRGSDFHVNGNLPGSISTFLSFPSFHHSLLTSCPFCAYLPLPAVVKQALNPPAVVLQRYLSPLSLCLLLHSSFPPSHPLFSLSSLMNGVAGLWAAHPQRGVAGHC